MALSDNLRTFGVSEDIRNAVDEFSADCYGVADVDIYTLLSPLRSLYIPDLDPELAKDLILRPVSLQFPRRVFRLGPGSVWNQDQSTFPLETFKTKI